MRRGGGAYSGVDSSDDIDVEAIDLQATGTGTAASSPGRQERSNSTASSSSDASTLPPGYRSRSHSLHNSSNARRDGNARPETGSTAAMPMNPQQGRGEPDERHDDVVARDFASGPAQDSSFDSFDSQQQHGAYNYRSWQSSERSQRRVDWALGVDDDARAGQTELAQHEHDHEHGAASPTYSSVHAQQPLSQQEAGQTGTSKEDPASFVKEPLARAMSDVDGYDEGTTFDDYDWDDDDELVKELDERYEQEYKKQRAEGAGSQTRRAVIRKFSPVHLAKVMFSTFLGNVILVLLLITPALVVQFLVKNPTSDAHLVFVCDNIQAWCYWVAFNFIARWVIHTAFELVPRLVVAIVELIWGDSNEKFRGYIELFTASKDYVKPLFFAGFFWGSFAVIFNSIFALRNNSDPRNSRAAYTYRIYQVVELLFFIAIVYSVEKILIRAISLRFHAVAYADRLKTNAFALATIDKLKDYKPKRKKPATPGLHSYARDHASQFSYFSSGALGGSGGQRSGAATPSHASVRSPTTAVSSPLQISSTILPPAPAPSHHRPLSARLPLPSAWKPKPESTWLEKDAIPMRDSPKTTNFDFDGQHRSHGPDAGTGSSSRKTSGSQTPATPAGLERPPTPGQAIAEAIVSADGERKGFFKGRAKVTAQEIARQAMVDPLKTLQNPTLANKGLSLDFASPADGKKLARDLFYAFRSSPARNYLITSDFYPAFATQAEAEAAFAVFDKDGNGDISRSEIRHTILAAYKERRYLARALQDASAAIRVLDRLFMTVSLFVIALIAFSVFNVNIYSNLTTAYTIAIAISFIFKSAAQNVFDSVIFLFATHPFDTGDRVSIDGDVYVVKQLGLFSTLFTRWDGTESLIANSKLNTLFITNYRRSAPQFENATLQVAWGTSLETLDALEKRMCHWLQTDEKRMFQPSTSIVLQSFDYMRAIEITVGMAHRANWQNWGERWEHRTAFHAALLHFSKELGITYVASPQPVQYWQEDLDAEPIYDDDDLLGDDLRSPLSPADGNGGGEVPAPLPPPQPLLGFLPPEGSTMRRRKGLSRKKMMAGVGA